MCIFCFLSFLRCLVPGGLARQYLQCNGGNNKMEKTHLNGGKGISPKCAAHRAKCYLIHGKILFGRICVTLYRPPLLTLSHWKESRSGWKEETPLNTSKGNITKMCTASCNKISSYLWTNTHHREIYHNSFIYILVLRQLISATTCENSNRLSKHDHTDCSLPECYLT